MDIKVFFGLVSVVAAVAGFFPYLIDILRRKTKPHAYSWLVWTVVGAVGFGIQLQGDAGPGSWLLGVTVLGTLIIFVLALLYGHKDIHRADTISLGVAAVAFVLWFFTDQPLLAAILITLVEAIGAYFPTFRKSYDKPQEETVLSYLAYAGSVGLSLLALENYDAPNVVYPAGVFVLNCALAVFLIVRRYQVKKPRTS